MALCRSLVWQWFVPSSALNLRKVNRRQIQLSNKVTASPRKPRSTQPQGITSDGTVLPDSDVPSDGKSVVDGKNSVSAKPTVTPDGMILPGDGTSAGAQADSDLGEQWVMKKNQKPPPPFTIFSDVSVFHTSNVALGHDTKLPTGFWSQP